jgi:hypothetical protein
MKFLIHFKTPDALDYVIKKHTQFRRDFEVNEEQIEEEITKLKSVAKKFIKFNEEIKVEFDTDAETATILPVK